jgi:hypothetical protein
MRCRAEIRTRACLTASQRTTKWPTLHPKLSHAAPYWATLHPSKTYLSILQENISVSSVPYKAKLLLMLAASPFHCSHRYGHFSPWKIHIVGQKIRIKWTKAVTCTYIPGSMLNNNVKIMYSTVHRCEKYGIEETEGLSNTTECFCYVLLQYNFSSKLCNAQN